MSSANDKSNTKGKEETKMAKRIIVAKFTHEDKQYVGKREVRDYDENSKMDSQLIADANVGLTLRTQRQIRDAVKSKNGLKSVSTGEGKSVDLSSIEAV